MKNHKNTIKRGISLLLTLAMCLGMLQITAFAEEPEEAPEEVTYGSPYDETIEKAEEVVVDEVKAEADKATEADKVANTEIEEITENVKTELGLQTDIVNAANGTIDSAAGVAAAAQEEAEAAKEIAEAPNTSIEEKRAAVTVAEAAAERAAEAAAEADNALNTANAAVEAAEQAVRDAEAAYAAALAEHDNSCDPAHQAFKELLEKEREKLEEARKLLGTAMVDRDKKESLKNDADVALETAQNAAKDAKDIYDKAHGDAEDKGLSNDKITGTQKEDLERMDGEIKDAEAAKKALSDFDSSNSVKDAQDKLSSAEKKLLVAQNQKTMMAGQKDREQDKVDTLTGKVGDAKDAASKAEDDLSSNKGEIEEIDSFIEVAENQLPGMEDSHKKKEDQVKEWQDKVDSVTGEKKTLESNIAATKTWDEKRTGISEGTNLPIVSGSNREMYEALEALRAEGTSTSNPIAKDLYEHYLNHPDTYSDPFGKAVEELGKIVGTQPDNYVTDLGEAATELSGLEEKINNYSGILSNKQGEVEESSRQIQELLDTINGKKSEKEALKALQPGLEAEWEAKKEALEELRNQLAKADEDLQKTLQWLKEQETIIHIYIDERGEAETALDAAKQNRKDLAEAYMNALNKLSKDLFGENGPSGTANLDNLKDAKAKLETAVDALKTYNEKEQVRQEKDVEAQKANETFENVKTGYEAAKAAVDKAQERYDSAVLEECSVKAIETLKAELEAAQADFNQAKIDLADAAEKKTQADEDAAQAAEDAEAARDALDTALENLAGDDDDDDTTAGTGAGEGLTILDGEVPLAGLMTRAEFVNYLYVREGAPETALSTFTDVAEDHEFAQAIGWAQANGIANGYADGTFDPDNLVLVSAARAFLTGYAAYKAEPLPQLTTLVGEDEDIVDNCDAVLAEYFGEIEA